MAETWVVNASPLISLAKIGRVDLLVDPGRRVLVPAAVADELVVDRLRLSASPPTPTPTPTPVAGAASISPSASLTWPMGEYGTGRSGGRKV